MSPPNRKSEASSESETHHNPSHTSDGSPVTLQTLLNKTANQGKGKQLQTSQGIVGYNPQESLENTINTMGTLLGLHPIVP